ncbi:ribosome-binding factor A [Thiocapsa imhoffii]|uniref:Ribosome-binding factor A n=1 Tax=Thiocapsa imhoffii TaxID=382777 RepID=A0A9X1B966_9GAMM|nr:30S ribosome-binding factor RbfA [Thiocapsa imhoffii]MBK1644750.1 ribosome-binding factor A [Thiocapsa imhoffii]
MKDFDRTERIGAELKRVLATLVRDEVKDPRLANITVHEIRVTRDLAHAKVFFTCFPVDEDPALQARLLNGRLAGFLRHALAQRVRLRTIPQLHFVFDESIGHGERLAALIEAAVKQDDESNQQRNDWELQVDGTPT